MKPQAEALDGGEIVVSTGWKVDDGIYVGEWAMIIEDTPILDPEREVLWLASGDLTDLRRLPLDRLAYHRERGRIAAI